MKEELAAFVAGLRFSDVPTLAVERSVDAMIDCLGCAFAGSREPIARIMRAALTTLPAGYGKAAPLLGARDYASPPDAALYNGTLAHALDFDDVTHPAIAHATAVLLPAILSTAPLAQVTGEDAIVAYVIGVEVFGKLGRALNNAHYRSGWHATSTFGTIAATAAAARMLHLDAGQARHALAIGASSASGLRANFGTMTKPLHAGYAARNGVLAAQLAHLGFTGTQDIFGADYGFAKTFNQRHETIAWDELRRWGDELEVLSEFGLALKPYPACGATHPSIEAAILLRGDLGTRVADIEHIEVGVPEMAFQPLIYPRPRSGLEGKFSMPFVVAAALLDGEVTLQTFTDERVADPGIRALMERIDMKADARVADSTEYACIMEARLAGGERRTRTVELAIGKPSRWFSREQLRHKFVSCMAGSETAVGADQLFERWLELSTARDLNSFVRRTVTTGMPEVLTD